MIYVVFNFFFIYKYCENICHNFIYFLHSLYFLYINIRFSISVLIGSNFTNFYFNDDLKFLLESDEIIFGINRCFLFNKPRGNFFTGIHTKIENFLSIANRFRPPTRRFTEHARMLCVCVHMKYVFCRVCTSRALTTPTLPRCSRSCIFFLPSSS